MSEQQEVTPPTEVKVAWSEESEAEAGRDFVGIIVSGQYPFKSEDAKFEGEQIQLLVRAEEPAYEKLQPIWLPPSDKKGSKFSLWRGHIVKDCPQAWREILPKVQAAGTPADQINAFINALVGMRFRFVDKVYPKPGRAKENMNPFLCPVAYKGRGQVQEVKTEKVEL